MKAIVVASGLLVICALLVSAAPHHERKESDVRPCTLAQIYGEIFGKAFEGFTNRSLIAPSKALLWLMLLSSALVAAGYPAVFPLLIHWPPISNFRGAGWIGVGIFVALGAFSNFLAMLVSHMTFGFGTSNSSESQTAFIWIIPGFQGIFAIATIALGCSQRFMSWLGHWLA